MSNETKRVYYLHDSELMLVLADEWDALRSDLDALRSAETLGEIRAGGLTMLQSWVFGQFEDDLLEFEGEPDAGRAAAWEEGGFEPTLGFLEDATPWDTERFNDAFWEAGAGAPDDAEAFGGWLPLDLEDHGTLVGGFMAYDRFIPTDLDQFLDVLRIHGFEPVENPDLHMASWW